VSKSATQFEDRFEKKDYEENVTQFHPKSEKNHPRSGSLIQGVKSTGSRILDPQP
jgi:hypothetical protein